MSSAIESKTWIVIPAYNEEKYLKTVLQKVLKYTPNVIVIDDGSADGTTTVAQSFPVYSLKHKVNLGKGAALKTAVSFAFDQLFAEAIVMLDADDQHDPSELPLFFKSLANGNQIVFGIRQEPKNMPWLRLKINRLGSFLTFLLFGKYILDIPSGYKAMTKAGYQKVSWEANDYAVELEIAAKTAKAKLPYDYVTIKTIYHDTDKGMTVLDVFSVLRHLIKLKATL